MVDVAVMSTHSCGDGAGEIAAEGEALVDERDDEGDEEQDHGDGAAIPRLSAELALLDHVGGHRRGGTERAAARGDPDHVEELERADDRQEGPDADGRTEQGDGDVPLDLPPAGA